MEDQNKNLILATVLSVIVILVWFLLFPPPSTVTDPSVTSPTAQSVPIAESGTGTNPGATTAIAEPAPVEQTSIATAARVPIRTPRLSGSISLEGGRIDDLSLVAHKETLDPDSKNITLLKPVGEDEAYYALFGWAQGVNQDASEVPGADTIWQLVSGTTLSPSSPIQLKWDNGTGLVFRRTIEVDENYLFTITQEVKNSSTVTVLMAPYSELRRQGEPKLRRNGDPNGRTGFFIIQEGVIRQNGDDLTEFPWGTAWQRTGMDELSMSTAWGPETEVEIVEEKGWIGFTDHYWMTNLIPEPGQPFTSVVRYDRSIDRFSTIARLSTQSVAPGQSVALVTRMFAGAKEWETIRNYENDQGIHNFLNSIDWGVFFFLTKPIFVVLHWLNGIIGNMGWSIIALTLVIKATLFPLAYKSYVSMAKMKELQPEMEKLKEKAGDDKQKLQKGMMELYKTNKVNPASGCLPILLQIPIFFSLYKVIFVTIELRHARWIGWIQDLSAPDPSSILNLFGLLPYNTPDPSSLLFIVSLGVMPIILGISMWLQQKLNPTPTDPTQAMIFAWMPWVFMFMLGRFASGLVLYWIANNMITFTQQYIIMRSHGAKPDLFGNITKSFKRKPKSEDK